MNKKYLQFTIGAANSLVRALVPANTDWFITMPTTSTLLFHSMGSSHTGSDVVTITFTTADTTYASHYAVVNALANANGAHSAPDVIIVPALPLVGSTQQLITSIVIA
jgi:hypothetical protein